MEKKTAIIIVLLILLLLVAAIPLLMISGVVLWQLGVFSAGSSGVNRAAGFSHVKAFDPSIQYSEDGELSFVVVNAVGAQISGIQLSFSGDCEDATYSVGELAGGESSQISVDCKPKNIGNSFSTDVEITYVEELAGQTISRTDSGRIVGTVGY